MNQPCGCVNGLNDNGVIHRVSTCANHKKMQTGLDVGLDYYHAIWVFDDTGCPTLSKRRNEFVRFFSEPIETDDHSECVLEIGCGVSSYVPLFMRRGWRYFGLEPAPWPARATREMFGVDVYEQKLEDLVDWPQFDAIVMAHCLEHLEDPVVAMRKVHDELCKNLATVYVIVPHGPDDFMNPDHKWFFDEESLRKTMLDAGFTIKSLSLQDGNERERYLYCEATK